MAKDPWAWLYSKASRFKPANEQSLLDRLRLKVGLGCVHCGASRPEFECETCRYWSCDYCSRAYTLYIRDFISEPKQSHPKLNDPNLRFCQRCSYAGFLECQQVLGMDQFLDRHPTAKRVRR